MENIYKTTVLPSGTTIVELDNQSESLNVTSTIKIPTIEDLYQQQLTIMDAIVDLYEALPQ